MEKKLKESEERLKKFMDSATDSFFLFDSNFNYVDVNKSGLTLFGLNKEDIIGKNILEIVPNLKETGRYEKYMDVIKTGKPFFIDDLIPHPIFGDIHISVRAFKVGNGLGIITTDITERKKAEAELSLHSEITTNMTEGVFLIRMDDGIIVYANPKFEKMFGYDPSEMIGKHVSIVNAPTDKYPEETAREIINILEKTGKWHGEVNNIKKDGTLFWCYANVSMFDHSDYGKVFVAVHTDITERKNAEEKIRKYSDHLKEVVEERTAELIKLNEQLKREIIERKETEEKLKKSEWKLKERVKELTCLYGISKIVEDPERSLDEIFQKTLDLIPPAWEFPNLTCAKILFDNKEYKTKNFKETKFKLSNTLKINEKLLELEIFYLEDKPFIEEEKLLINDIGNRLKIILEQKEADKELKESQEQLMRQEKLAVIGRLASSIGHELRNPLGVISNSVYYLNMKLKDTDEKVTKYLNILEGEVQRSNRIISHLLDFAKIKSLSLEEVDVNKIVKDVLENIKLPNNIILEKYLDVELPKIQLDASQIQQAFQNIILNAVEAMPRGGNLEIKTLASENIVEIIVKDTGIGIPKDNIHKLFEPLFTTKVKGIGLGLSIVKEIIEKHKGKIEAESKVDKGTTFTIKLPLLRKEGM